jgi:hypothetical protein
MAVKQFQPLDTPSYETLLQHYQSCPLRQTRRLTAASEQQPSRKRLRTTRVKDDVVATFLKKIPQASQWGIRQHCLIGTAEQYECIIRSLITSSASPDTSNASPELRTNNQDVKNSNGLITVGLDFALRTNSSLEIVELQTMVSYFQALVLLSYCVVLLQHGMGRDNVHKIMASVTRFGSSTLNYDRLCHGATRVNDMISRLVKAGWTISRATELIFFGRCNKSLYHDKR